MKKVELILKIKKLKAMPFSEIIYKLSSKLYKKIKNALMKQIDFKRDTHSSKHYSLNYSYIDINTIDTSNINIEACKFLCDMYTEHYFDILGSGFVKFSYNQNTIKTEEKLVEYGNKIIIESFDEGGEWLRKLLRPSHLKTAKNIWRNIDKAYIPIDWSLEVKCGYRYSQKNWYLEQPIGKPKGVDIKVPWELGRLQHLPQLAIFGIIFPEKRKQLLNEFKNQVLDFIMVNPPRMGVQWACTMDTAIRAANILTAYDMFKQLDEYNILDEYFEKIVGTCIYEHGNFIINNLEYSIELTGNHYLSNISGLLYASAYLKRNNKIDAWLAFSIQEIISEVLKQFNVDGTNFEASTSYHRLSSELLIYSTGLIYGILNTNKLKALTDNKLCKIHRLLMPDKQKFDIASEDFFPEDYLKRLYGCVQFISSITKPNGNIVQIGDNDSGRFFKLSPNGEIISKELAMDKYINLKNSRHTHALYFDEKELNHDTLISAANGLFLSEALFEKNKYNLEKTIIMSLSHNKLLKAVPFSSEIKAFTGQIPQLSYYKSKEISYSDYGILNEKLDLSKLKLIAYPCFGLYIFRTEDFFLTVMGGGIGQMGRGGHGHNDKLSFEFCLKDKDIFIDPGTYVYTSEPELRNSFRGIKAHNVPIINDEEQCSFLGLFLMKNEINCEIIEYSNDYISMYLTYRDIAVIREFRIACDKLLIIDRCNKPFSQNFMSFNFMSNGYGKLIAIQ